MLQVFAAPFCAAVLALERAKALMATMEDLSEATRHAVEKLGEFHSECKRLPVTNLFRDRVERLRGKLGSAPYDSAGVQMQLLHDLSVDFLQELGASVFVGIPETESDRWLKPHGAFGREVVGKFGIGKDVEGAIRCLVMEQWTASVFHSMRIMEIGLRWLADRLGVPFAIPFELQNWQNIIGSIEKAARALEQALPKGAAKSEEITFYASAASHFFFVKEAWRNHVSHSRENYDSSDARRIYENVRGFMEALATKA